MYTILSLSPLLVITIKIASFFLGSDEAQLQVSRQLSGLLGVESAKGVEQMIVSVSEPGAGVVATIVSVAILIFTASGVFGALRASLNEIWEVKPAPDAGWWQTIRSRLLSIGMVFVIGFLFLTSQVVTTVLTAMARYASSEVGQWSFIIDFIVSTIVIAMLFATIFRYLADVNIAWRDVALGAIVTAILFKAGQYVQLLYFTYGAPTSAYGAAGSFVAVLLWVYYSCWVMFFGAELTQAFVRHCHRQIEPSARARKLTNHQRRENKSGTVE
jgi:membrane protein